MPTATFEKLPAEKRQKLLHAAVREFCERPYNEASINQIVKEAGIARGSFYMYFRDKEELFCYVLHLYLEDLAATMEEILRRRDGDIFAAMPELYDRVRSAQKEELGAAGPLSAILRQNRGMQKSGILELLDVREFLLRLEQAVNPALLDVRQEGELHEILGLMLCVTMPILYNSFRPEQDNRAHLMTILDILERGMGSKSARPE